MHIGPRPFDFVETLQRQQQQQQHQPHQPTQQQHHGSSQGLFPQQAQHGPTESITSYYVYGPYGAYGAYYAPLPAAPAPLAQPQQFLPHGLYQYPHLPSVAYCDPTAMPTYPGPSPPWQQHQQTNAVLPQQIPRSPSSSLHIPLSSKSTTASSPEPFPADKRATTPINFSSQKCSIAVSGRKASRGSSLLDKPIKSSRQSSDVISISRTTQASYGDDATEETPSSSLGRNAGSHLRSDHVMWVGNIPSNATQSELRDFFSQLPLAAEGLDTESTPDGIVSIFIIGRSNCAFVNFSTEAHLSRAVDFFNNKSLRSQDPRALKLVCRVRKKEEEAQAGVAGQRGKGFHIAFLKEYKRRTRETKETQKHSNDRAGRSLPSRDRVLSALSSMEQRDDEIASTKGENWPRLMSAHSETSSHSPARDDPYIRHSSPNYNSSGDSTTSSSAEVSYTSTNSDLLLHRAFRERYFILKSRSIEELERSTQSGYWSTQPHNEAVLDQAYRHSEKVVLIFSANASGAFFGYARMASDIAKRDHNDTVDHVNLQQDGENCDSGSSTQESAIHENTTESFDRDPLQSKNLVAEIAKFPSQMIPAGAQQPERAVLQPSDLANASSGLELSPDGTSEQGLRDESMSRAMPSRCKHEVNMFASQADRVKRRDMAQRNSSSISFEALSLGKPQKSYSFDGFSDRSPSSPGLGLGPSDYVSGYPHAASQLVTRAVIHNLRLEQRESQRKAEQLERQFLVQEQLASAGTGRILSENEMVTSAQEGRATPTIKIPGADIDVKDSNENLGAAFKVEWLQTRPVPFSAVKKLRNPWNENKSLRVARDGTEIAIDTGVELISLWEKYVKEHPQEDRI